MNILVPGIEYERTIQKINRVDRHPDSVGITGNVCRNEVAGHPDSGCAGDLVWHRPATASVELISKENGR